MRICNLVVLIVPLGVCLVAANGVEPCPRPRVGSVVDGPPDLRSQNGLLSAQFSFRGYIDGSGLLRFCYLTENGVEAPTLRAKPGDEVVLTLKNDLPKLPEPVARHEHAMPNGDSNDPCDGGFMSPVSTNLHFHGLYLPPVCHQDEVIHTLIQPSSSPFEYRFKIPANQPPGLYWYHPHPHGFSEMQVLGGASGALIVEGIEEAKPQVAGLPERVLVLRDQIIPRNATVSDEGGDGPAKNISVNFVPIMFPTFLPAVIRVKPMGREFWRVLNASADTYFDLQVIYGQTIQNVHIPQPLELIAVDGAPVGPAASAAIRKNMLLPPGARAEFIVAAPAQGTYAQLVTRAYDTGPDGENDTYRVIANIVSRSDAPVAGSTMPAVEPASMDKTFVGLTGQRPIRERRLYFSEDRRDLVDPKKRASYFITVEGQTPKEFDMSAASPNITVEQGTVEDWTIENRAREAHAFHIHQLHFQLLERDGRKVDEQILRDTIDLPYWNGKDERYPSVKLRMDFRDPNIIGTFLYHCHLLEHEDGGMMGSIRVIPPRR